MTEKLKVLDLFSGIGGFSLGLERTGGFETVAFCEIDPFCQKVLKKHWPDVPIYEDVRALDYDGSIDVITGGYPCQPFSVAGKREGEKDDRHLWPAMFGLIKKYRPDWVIGENVAGHISMGLDSVLADLEGEGYSTRTFIIPAVAVDAKHRRDRVWVVANTECPQRRPGQSSRYVPNGENAKWEKKTSGPGASSSHDRKRALADADSGCVKAGAERAGRQEGADFSRRCAGAVVGDASVERLQDGGSSQMEQSRAVKESERSSGGEALANPGCARRQEQHIATKPKKSGHDTGGRYSGRGVTWWPIESDVGRVASGIPRRVDRLKSLGNAVVPQIPEMIGHAILESHYFDMMEAAQ